MLRNIVGVFDRNNAQQVRSALLARGFPESDIHVTESDDISDTASVDRDRYDDREKEGGIMHFFKELFGADDDRDETSGYVETYSDAVKRGNCVVAVTIDNDDEIRSVEDIMEDHHAINIDEESQAWRNDATTMRSGMTDDADLASSTSRPPGVQQSGALSDNYKGFDDVTSAGAVPTSESGFHHAEHHARTMDQSNLNEEQRAALLRADTTRTDNRTMLDDENAVLPVVREELQVGKRVVQKGGVRIFSRLTETPVEETVSLREENVSVDRRPTDRPVTDADLSAMQEGQVEVRGMAEEAVVQKTARVVEEVVVGKQATEHTETIRDTVRNTEVNVEPLADNTVRSDKPLKP